MVHCNHCEGDIALHCDPRLSQQCVYFLQKAQLNGLFWLTGEKLIQKFLYPIFTSHKKINNLKKWKRSFQSSQPRRVARNLNGQFICNQLVSCCVHFKHSPPRPLRLPIGWSKKGAALKVTSHLKLFTAVAAVKGAKFINSWHSRSGPRCFQVEKQETDMCAANKRTSFNRVFFHCIRWTTVELWWF